MTSKLTARRIKMAHSWHDSNGGIMKNQPSAYQRQHQRNGSGGVANSAYGAP